MAATAGEGYDEALANVESIYMNPDSGLFPQYLDPKLADLLPHHMNQSPELWFTYHVYHKSPDWIRPTISGHLNIP